MAERIIPLYDQRATALPAVIPERPIVPSGLLVDARSRPLRDLRISVTDRCNFRCAYCMPKEVFNKDYAYLPQSDLLTFEEITRIARLFVAHGVRKLRLTGGEPLLRKNLEVLINMLSAIETPDGEPLDITLTTNGSLLRKKAKLLKEAGLKRITVSLDALDDAVFRRMNDVDYPVAQVLDGIAAAQVAGIGNIKVNMVVKRGTNDQEILPMACHFRATGITLRFIEYMDVGSTNGWSMEEVLPSREVRQRIHSEMPLVQLDPSSPGETAERWGYADSSGKHDPALGEIGLISSVTKAFCRDCNRARLSTDGKLYLCLFATQGYDLRSLLRGNASDADILSAIAHIWQGRQDRYSELRGSMQAQAAESTSNRARRVEMSYIGG